MRFREIADGLFQAGRKATNIYLITSEQNSILIDTGEPSFAPHILRALDGFPKVQHILLTHAHYDHSGSAAALSDHFEANVWAHPAEVALLKTGAWHRAQIPAPSLFGHLMTNLIAKRFPDHVTPPNRLHPVQAPGTDPLLGLRTITLPGHCQGQIGFGLSCPDGSAAWIVGDVIMTSLGLREPILYEDRSAGLTSITRLAEALDGGDLVCPGHGKALRVDAGLIAKLRHLGSARSL